MVCSISITQVSNFATSFGYSLILIGSFMFVGGALAIITQVLFGNEHKHRANRGA